MRRTHPDPRVRKLQQKLTNTTDPRKRAEIQADLELIAEDRAEQRQADREAGIW
jgi:hypothetical protein